MFIMLSGFKGFSGGELLLGRMLLLGEIRYIFQQSFLTFQSQIPLFEPHFVCHLQMLLIRPVWFPTISTQYHHLLQIFVVICKNLLLPVSKILSSGIGLTLSQTNPGFYVSAVQLCRKRIEKRRNCS